MHYRSDQYTERHVKKGPNKNEDFICNCMRIVCVFSELCRQCSDVFIRQYKKKRIFVQQDNYGR